jgi:hypothetical protein
MNYMLQLNLIALLRQWHSIRRKSPFSNRWLYVDQSLTKSGGVFLPERTRRHYIVLVISIALFVAFFAAEIACNHISR